MIITSNNSQLINTATIYAHDLIFNKFYYDYQNNEINIVTIDDITGTKENYFRFINVLSFEMIACDFWGQSPHILDWVFVESNKSKLVKKLLDERKKNQYDNSRIDAHINYLETVFTFISGDRLTIACESIELTGERFTRNKVDYPFGC